MSKLIALFVLSCLLAMAMAEPRIQQQQQQQRQLQHPYVFLSVPKGRANAGAIVGGFEIVEQDDDVDGLNDADDDDDDDDDASAAGNINHLIADDDDDDDDEDADDDDDEDDEIEKPAEIGLAFARNGQVVVLNDLSGNIQQIVDANDNDVDDDDDAEHHADAEDVQLDDDVTVLLARSRPERLTRKAATTQVLKTAKPTQMMVARDQAGAIMVPDGIIEIEGQNVIDEKTGKSALLVPRAALDAIPDGSVVALMERSAMARNAGGLPADGQLSVAAEEERANRVIVRRRRKGGRRNVRRRRRPSGQRRRRPSGQRRRRRRPNGNRRRNVTVVRPNNMRRRRGGQRRRPVVLQG